MIVTDTELLCWSLLISNLNEIIVTNNGSHVLFVTDPESDVFSVTSTESMVLIFTGPESNVLFVTSTESVVSIVTDPESHV